MAKSTFTTEQKKAAVAMMAEGMTRAEVARTYDVAPVTLDRWRKQFKHDIVIAKPKIEHKIVVANEAIEDAHAEMQTKAIKATDETIDVLMDMIRDKESPPKIDQITRALTAIAGTIKVIGNDKNGNSPKNGASYFNHIEQLIISNHEGDSEFCKTIDITPDDEEDNTV